jgi:hypothetical protein
MFKDQYAEKNFVFESQKGLVVLAMFLATFELILAGCFFYLLQLSAIVTLLAYVGLIYGMLQLLHIYDYLRARRSL